MPAGRLQYFISNWELLGSPQYICDWVMGLKIPFARTPYQVGFPRLSNWSPTEQMYLQQEILQLLFKGVIQKAKSNKNQFLSSYFVVDKSDGGKRFILNLKKLIDVFIDTPHFKMEDSRTAMKLICQGNLLTKIDLQDTLLSIPVHPSFKRFLRFQFNNCVYEFNVLPFGLSIAPYIFTKLLKPFSSYLRAQGILCVCYIDDLLLIHTNMEVAKQNNDFVLTGLRHLGFTVNSSKSCCVPSTRCKFLGFVFDSQKMRVELPMEKKLKIVQSVTIFLSKKMFTIQIFAQLIGLLVSACPAVKYGKLYTKSLEREKFLALQKNNQNYQAKMNLSQAVIEDLQWWKDSISSAYKEMNCTSFSIEIYTDASSTGWGAVSGVRNTFGFWSNHVKRKHINFLELKAAFLGLRHFMENDCSKNILLRIDNTTVISYINRMGGIQHVSLFQITEREFGNFVKKEICGYMQLTFSPKKIMLIRTQGCYP